MTEILLFSILIFVILNFVFLLKNKNNEFEEELRNLETEMRLYKEYLEKMERGFKEEFLINRNESNNVAAKNREELNNTLNSFSINFSNNVRSLKGLFAELNAKLTEDMRDIRNLIDKNLKEMQFSIEKELKEKFVDFKENQAELERRTFGSIKEIKESIEKNLEEIRKNNSDKLEEMRRTVDEKLQETLNARLKQSFETVGMQLKHVQEGLGEMKNIANEVGGLKNALSNVKVRGEIGEWQLEMLLEQILAPEQYAKNVRTKQKSKAMVEFVIKLPGRDEEGEVLLPIDAKFPKDAYDKLQNAYENGSADEIKKADKELENAIKTNAKDISEKYINPPVTTDFAIMFLPFEGLYSEVVRRSELLKELQTKYNIIVAGPTTFAALLNSLQIGFKTLQIQKRSGEIWKILEEVKREFDNFGNMLTKAKSSFEQGMKHLDKVMTTRTNVMNKTLKKLDSKKENMLE